MERLLYWNCYTEMHLASGKEAPLWRNGKRKKKKKAKQKKPKQKTKTAPGLINQTSSQFLLNTTQWSLSQPLHILKEMLSDIKLF